METPRSWPMVMAMTLVLAACGANKMMVNTNGLENIEALQRDLDTTDAETPTVGQYQSARGEFVTSMKATMNQEAAESGSSLRTIKHIIVGAGAVLGLGSMIVSFIVDDDDTKTTIAQTGGAVAGVASVVGLLPLGSEAKGGHSVGTYLSLELPRFEARWPHDIPQALTANEWTDFKRDAQQMQTMVEQLRR
ncbi:MAG: hypothetical protein OEN01_01165 [Candidatus Krumholzibacteria bacterium]|nr:hypothetical protein [Candidatus Krumholzibacteria bacterium]